MTHKRIFAALLAAVLLLAPLSGCREKKKTPDETGVSSAGQSERTPSSDDCAHEYEFTRFEWGRDQSAEAVYVCKKDPAHIERRPAEVTSTVIEEATPVKAGRKTSTARCDGHEETVTGPYLANEVTLTVYAVNDFHGAVKEEPGRAGLGKFATYFKEKGEDPNTLLLDQGDTWQGSILSNYNYGALICNVYNYVRFDAKTIGNHEFDWGTEAVKENAARSSYDYQTPFLAANIYDYNFNTKTAGSVQQARFGQKSVTYTMASGLKVGIIGVIGSQQITSINSLYTQDICFVDHVRIIREEAEALRAAGCDVVICSIHAEQGAVMKNGLEKYVDLVLCAHTHSLESGSEGDLLYAQFRANGEYFGRIDMTYHTASGKVTASQTPISADEVKKSVQTVDPVISELIEKYTRACEEEADDVIADNVYGTFDGRDTLPNLMCRAMFDAARKAGYDVCLAYVNKARASMPSGVWTYADLYDAFPFDDMVYIADISGRELLDEVAKYNFIYRSPDFTDKTIDPNKTYRIACADYLFFHTNAQRFYDYFPRTAGNYVGVLEDNYRVLLREWLAENGYASGRQLSVNSYSSLLAAFNRDSLHE